MIYGLNLGVRISLLYLTSFTAYNLSRITVSLRVSVTLVLRNQSLPTLNFYNYYLLYCKLTKLLCGIQLFLVGDY